MWHRLGIGNRADDGDLPTPNARKTKQASWTTKNIFGRIQISDKTMRASRNSRGAFVSLLEADLEDALTDAKDNLSRQVYGNGTGILATCTAQSSVTTLTISSVQFFSEGMLIDILDSTGTTVKQAGREVTSVDDVNSTITISGAAVTTLATDIIAVSGSYGLELTGFGAVFAQNNVIYGIDRSVDKWFNPTLINVGGEISEVMLQKAEDEVDRKAGGKISLYATSYGVRRAYQNLLLATKQIVDVLELKGGWKTLSYNGKGMVTDKYAPNGVLHGLDMTTWKNYSLADWDWLDDDGAVLSRVSGKAVWEATLAKYSDLGCNKPRGNVKLYGITEH